MMKGQNIRKGKRWMRTIIYKKRERKEKPTIKNEWMNVESQSGI